MQDIRQLIRHIDDFPSKGVGFKDITPLMQNPQALQHAIAALLAPFAGMQVDAVAGLEARGFIFGALAAQQLGVSFVPLRKAGKLPSTTHAVDYQLEYGTARMEVHTDALTADQHVLLVDDVLATGGTARAGCELIEKLGATIIGCSFLMEIAALGGRHKLNPHAAHALVQF